MSILLTEEEIITAVMGRKLDVHREICPQCTEALLKAQIKKMLEWGNEPCPHFDERDRHGYMIVPDLKRECSFCWSELQKEIGE